MSATRDRPSPGTAPDHWATIGEAGMSAGLWLLWFVHRTLGRWGFRVLMAPAVVWFVALRPVARHASIEYLTRVGVLSPASGTLARWRAAIRHFQSFAETVLDKALVWGGRLDVRDAPAIVDPRFGADAAAGRGGVMLVAHHGNLEVLRAFGRRLPALRLNVLVHSANSVRFMRVLERLDPKATLDLLQVTQLDAAMASLLADRVARGEWVVIAADRIPVTGGERTVEAPFLGRPAAFPIGPWVLARSVGGPVYWLSCTRHAGTYRFECRRFAERIELPRASRAAAIGGYVARYADLLEAQCRDTPYQWYNFYPFWRASGDHS